jgi:hypothetical protein
VLDTYTLTNDNRVTLLQYKPPYIFNVVAVVILRRQHRTTQNWLFCDVDDFVIILWTPSSALQSFVSFDLCSCEGQASNPAVTSYSVKGL